MPGVLGQRTSAANCRPLVWDPDRRCTDNLQHPHRVNNSHLNAQRSEREQRLVSALVAPQPKTTGLRPTQPAIVRSVVSPSFPWIPRDSGCGFLLGRVQNSSQSLSNDDL